jgi:hypothetical protein
MSDNSNGAGRPDERARAPVEASASEPGGTPAEAAVPVAQPVPKAAKPLGMSEPHEGDAGFQLDLPGQGPMAAPANAGEPEEPAVRGAGPAVVEAIWRNTRKGIAESYCRVVAVIDDDIERTPAPLFEGEQGATASVGVSPRFWQLRSDLQAKKILCHLHTYPKTEMSADHPNAEALLEVAASVASAANVVILDWHLGKESGSDHAEALLEKLLECGGLRFVIINSNDEPSRIKERLQIKQFRVALTFTEPGKTPETTIGAKLGQQIFLLIRKKSDLAQTDADAASLVEQVFSWMETTFPDHLHWAGLELSARVAEMLPSVLSSLPKTTDVPLFHQWLFNEDLETNDQIVAFLLDELGIQFGLRPLKALDEGCVQERIKERMAALIAANFIDSPVVQELWKDVPGLKAALKKLAEGAEVPPEFKASAPAVAALAETWNTVSVQNARKTPNNDWMSHFPGSKKPAKEVRVAAYLRRAFDVEQPAFTAWSALYESTLGDLGSPRRLFTGFVLKKTGGVADNAEWLLCVTPGCDCRWEKVEAFAFLPGAETADPAGSTEKVVTCVNTSTDGAKNIAWNARQIILKEKSKTGGLVDGYTLAGSIRPMHAVRIAQRTWSHQMRVAVDVPDYVRAQRKEGDL